MAARGNRKGKSAAGKALRKAPAPRISDATSLRRELAGLSRDEYVTAREQAAAQTGFDLRTFPKWLPDKAEQILDEGSYPGPLDER